MPHISTSKSFSLAQQAQKLPALEFEYLDFLI